MLASRVVHGRPEMSNQTSLIQPEQIEQAILLIRGQRVMLDRDLAALYGVTTGNLNKAVQRNPERFPPDFMFQVTANEARALRFQFGSLKRGQHFKYLPQVFTQEGVAMLSSVLCCAPAATVTPPVAVSLPTYYLAESTGTLPATGSKPDL